jgi:hypothetical protein
VFKNGNLIKIIVAVILTALVAFIFSTANKVDVNSQRISRLETLIEPLRSVPADVAALRTTGDRNKDSLDRIEKKLDAHMDKGK